MEWKTTSIATWLLLILCGIACEPASAADFFVDPTGNNSAAGSALAPWQTLQFAADHVGPGDRVTVRAGNYTGFQLDD